MIAKLRNTAFGAAEFLDVYVRLGKSTALILCVASTNAQLGAWLGTMAIMKGTTPTILVFEAEDHNLSASLADAVAQAQRSNASRVAVVVCEQGGPSFVDQLEKARAKVNNLSIFRISARTPVHEERAVA